MLNIENIKGIIFDYGGTIDTNGMHWGEVIWMSYEALKIPVGKDIYRMAYVHGERYLATNPVIQPQHNFWHVLRLKAEVQIQWLLDNEYLKEEADFKKYTTGIADWCYAYAQTAISGALPIIKQLADKYPLALVSNFYGNIETVLKDFHLAGFFKAIIESAVVGIRKPDPAIFQLGIDRLELSAGEVIVIGDSYEKDILPATTLGCETVWLKNVGWNDYSGKETAGFIISDFSELNYIFKL